MADYQLRNRVEIATDILRNVLGSDLIDGVATGTVDTSSLQDTKWLYKGGTDHYKGRQAVIYDATGSIVDGESSWVASSVSTDCTCAPVFSASITTGDKYLLIPSGFTIDEVYGLINGRISYMTGKYFSDKITATTYTERDKREYACLTGFNKIHSVEYVASVDNETACDAVWTAATYVTATQDTELYRGHVCTKLTSDIGTGVDGLPIGYVASSITDYSNYDTFELWIRSSIAQTATYLELRLCSDTAGVTAVDTISLPALTIDTWTRLQLTLTNPELDTAIRSIALYQKASQEIGACKIWVEYGKALKADSRVYRKLSPEQWRVIPGSTPYLRVNAVPADTLLRLTGYTNPALITDNTTDADIDPSYLVAAVTADMLVNHATNNDREANLARAKVYLDEARQLQARLTLNAAPNTV